MELNQGYRIIERFPVGEQGFALAYSPTAPNPFVTWQFRTDEPHKYFWGHYCNDVHEAYIDYEMRIDNEAEYHERETHEPFPLPKHCLTVHPSTGELVNIKRGIGGYFPSDCSVPKDREENRVIANYANESLGVSKAQEAAMLSGSIYGWERPAADPRMYDAEGKMRREHNKDTQERER